MRDHSPKRSFGEAMKRQLVICSPLASKGLRLRWQVPDTCRMLWRLPIDYSLILIRRSFWRIFKWFVKKINQRKLFSHRTSSPDFSCSRKFTVMGRCEQDRPTSRSLWGGFLRRRGNYGLRCDDGHIAGTNRHTCPTSGGRNGSGFEGNIGPQIASWQRKSRGKEARKFIGNNHSAAFESLWTIYTEMERGIA